MQVLSTQSRGYDTTAINSIAAKYGLDKVFTCTTARDKSAFVGYERNVQSDDGTDIGKAIGFDCVAIDRLAYQKIGLPEEAFYFASAYQIADVNLLEINNHVAGSAMLLNGTLGEIWRDKKYYDHNRRHWLNDELFPQRPVTTWDGRSTVTGGDRVAAFSFHRRPKPRRYLPHWLLGGNESVARWRRLR